MAERVIVYSGYGTTTICYKLLEASLQQQLSSKIYKIELWDDQALLNDSSWTKDCKLICFGGGFDEGMVKSLGEYGMALIKEYIMNGGQYLGICAGAYFACREISFDANGPLHVKGTRSIGLFEGKGVGPVYPGFRYDSEMSSRATMIRKGEIDVNSSFKLFPDLFSVYYNGGCTFIPDHQNHRRCNKLYYFANKVDCPSIIHCQLGAGAGILCGVHPEFDPQYLVDFTKDPDDLQFLQENVIPQLMNDNTKRRKLMKGMLTLLGLSPLNYR